MIKKIEIMLFFLVFILGCGNKEKVITPVQTEMSVKSPKKLNYEYPGVVIADKDTPISFRVAGLIVKMNIEIGDFFKKGEVIAEIDPRDYKIQVKVFEKKVNATKNVYLASVAIAENTNSQYKRIEKLYKEKSISKKSYDQALGTMKSSASTELAELAQYEVALQELRNAKNQLVDTELKANFDGYINSKYFDVGAVVAPGIPVVSMSSNKNSKVRINVSENDLKKLSLLSEAKFIHNNTEYNLKLNTASKVKGIGKIAYPITFDFSKKIDENIFVDSEGIVQLIFENPKKNTVLIPSKALFGENKKIMVWIYKDNHVTKKVVSNILPYDNGTVIVSGILENERVVTKGVNELFENQEVKLLKGFSETNNGGIL